MATAARVVFARDGYHPASLEAIAREAGYSKGAVYSNFEGKADLFLVMDTETAQLEGDWDPFGRTGHVDAIEQPVGGFALDEAPTELELSIGFGFATLEFVAVAGRDPVLRDAIDDRLGKLIGAYGRQLESRQRPDDPLDTTELATILAAFDQGSALFTLGGWGGLDARLIHRGLQRLLQPAPDESA